MNRGRKCKLSTGFSNRYNEMFYQASSQNDVRKAHHRHDIGMNEYGQAPEFRGVEPSESINFPDECG